MPESSGAVGGPTQRPVGRDAVPPADRYGPVRTASERRRRRRWAAAGAGGIGLLALLWVGSTAVRVHVEARDTGFVIVDEQTVEVSFVVTKPPDATVLCRVRALSPSFAEVGVVDVPVGPSTGDTVPVTVRLATSEPATTGVVQACRLIDP